MKKTRVNNLKTPKNRRASKAEIPEHTNWRKRRRQNKELKWKSYITPKVNETPSQGVKFTLKWKTTRYNMSGAPLQYEPEK